MRGRIPRPWYRVGTNSWYCTFNGKQVRLGRTQEEAVQLFTRITKKREEQLARGQIRNAVQTKGDMVSRVYFVRDMGTKDIKIGVSVDPQGRLDSMRVGHPGRLELLGSIPGFPGDERHLHRQFRRLRVRGEWFREDPSLLEEIEYLLARGFK
jgi:hypothetical protein